MSKSWLQFYKKKNIYTCIPRLFIAFHVLYMTQCIFECDIIMVVLKSREIKKNVQKLKQTTELSKFKSIKMHALFEHFGTILSTKACFYNIKKCYSFKSLNFSAVGCVL